MKFRKSKVNHSPMHRMWVQRIDRSKPILIDDQNRQLIPTVWKEEMEVNIGSVVNPNKEVILVKFQPIVYEHKDEDDSVHNFLKRF